MRKDYTKRQKAGTGYWFILAVLGVVFVAEPVLRKIVVNDVTLAYFERGEVQSDRPTLYLVHATGFHARVWDNLAEQFPEYHIVALEQRGHGRSDPVGYRTGAHSGRTRQPLSKRWGCPG